MRFLVLATLAATCAAQAPGIPPLVLDEYECIFHRGIDDKGYAKWCGDRKRGLQLALLLRRDLLAAKPLRACTYHPLSPHPLPA